MPGAADSHLKSKLKKKTNKQTMKATSNDNNVQAE